MLKKITTSLRLSNEEIYDITCQACKILRDNTYGGHTVLSFVEGKDTLTPKLLVGDEANGKSDLFPRDVNPGPKIFQHLGTLYGTPGEIFVIPVKDTENIFT